MDLNEEDPQFIERKARMKSILNSIPLHPTKLRALESVAGVENWSSPFGQSLLSGKFIGIVNGKYVQSKLSSTGSIRERF